MAYLTKITNLGFAAIVDLIAAGSACYVGWGTGVTEADPVQTDLVNASNEARVVGTESQPAADTQQWVATVTAAGNQTVTEVGLFDGAGAGTPPSGGVMWLRKNLAAVVLLTGDSIAWTITIQATQ